MLPRSAAFHRRDGPLSASTLSDGAGFGSTPLQEQALFGAQQRGLLHLERIRHRQPTTTCLRRGTPAHPTACETLSLPDPSLASCSASQRRSTMWRQPRQHWPRPPHRVPVLRHLPRSPAEHVTQKSVAPPNRKHSPRQPVPRQTRHTAPTTCAGSTRTNSTNSMHTTGSAAHESARERHLGPVRA